MKPYLFSFLALVLLLLSNCDGRIKTKQSLKESISKFKATHQNLEEIFYPKGYVEIKTDTIFANKMQVSIKNYTLMNEKVLMSEIVPNIEMKRYHRAFEAEITIYNVSHVILSTKINARNFKFNTNSTFWKNATLEHAWVNQNSNTKNTITIELSFINLTNNTYKFYKMKVDKNGYINTYLIEEQTS